MMTVADFFNTWPGMFLAQSFLHSLLAALLVDIALIAWKIEEPRIRLPFRLIVIATPILSFPLYQFLFPDRGSQAFRLDALFDINRWLTLELWGSLSIGFLFLLFLAFAAAVFLFQEMIPIVRHTVAPDDIAPGDDRPAEGSPVAAALNELPGGDHDVRIIDDEEPLIFSSTGKQPAIFISRGLVEMLEAAELKAAIAHEIGHIARSKRPFMVFVFLLRIVMFYNPVVLMEFRRIVQEEEKICDDYAVSLTGSRAALAGALNKLCACTETAPHHHDRPEQDRLKDRIEEYSHALLMESRISRLEEPPPQQQESGAVFAVTAATIASVNYFLV